MFTHEKYAYITLKYNINFVCRYNLIYSKHVNISKNVYSN